MEDNKKGKVGNPAWKKGVSGNVHGCPKGTKHIATKDVIEDIVKAYTERGGINYLKTLDNKLFVRLLEKVLPKESNLNITGTLETLAYDRDKTLNSLMDKFILEQKEQTKEVKD